MSARCTSTSTSLPSESSQRASSTAERPRVFVTADCGVLLTTSSPGSWSSTPRSSRQKARSLAITRNIRSSMGLREATASLTPLVWAM